MNGGVGRAVYPVLRHRATTCRSRLSHSAANHRVLRQHVPGYGWREILGPRAERGASARTAGGDLAYWVRSGVASTLLPKGFPAAVRENYWPYVQWTALGLVSGRVQSVLATQAMLFTAGLGAGAIPMAAAIQWVLKDGVGHAGAIMYAALVNTRFDADAKRYRFQATVALTLADLVAVVMPLCPQYFFIMASVSSATSSIANLAQTASRARVMASFALHGNIADCTRAGQTQAKITSIAGTSLGAYVSWIIGPDPYAVAACMLPLATLSIYSMYVSSRLVVLRSLNVQRAELVFSALLADLEPDLVSPAGGGLRPPTPEQIAAIETFATGYRSPFRLGLVLQPLIAAGEPSMLELFTKRRGVDAAAVRPLAGAAGVAEAGASGPVWECDWHVDGAYALARTWVGREPVLVWYAKNTPPEDRLRAVWHACVIRHVRDMQHPVSGCRADDIAHAMWPSVLEALQEADWTTSSVHLDGTGAFLESTPR